MDAKIEPGAQLPAGLAQNPVANRHDQPALFGELDKFVGRDHPSLRMIPANQRFDAGNFLRFEVEFGLVMQRPLLLLDCISQIGLEFHVTHRKRLHVLVEELIADLGLVLLAVLLRAHRVIEQGFHAVGIGRIKADADVAGKIHGIAIDLDRLVDEIEDALDRPGSVFLFRQVGKQHRELVTGEA